ncbi:MAG: hypothetical protein J6R04_08670 [Clostridia bacterium]|nr:hypothetical protein [Clostridia bacterium]
MKQNTRTLIRVIISIAYIIWGILSPITAIKAVLALNIGALASAAVGVLTLIAGVLGLIGVKKRKCRLMGVVILIVSVITIFLTLPAISWRSIINAILAWLFIVCI